MSDVVTTDAAKAEAVKAEVDKDIAKAQEWMIKEEDIANARLVVGIDTARGSGEQTWVGPATPNAIKRFAYSVGDDNPLYWDPNYGPGTRWGAMIAPGSMAQHMM